MTAIPLAEQIAAVRAALDDGLPAYLMSRLQRRQRAAMEAAILTLETVVETARIEDELRRNGERLVDEMGGEPF